MRISLGFLRAGWRTADILVASICVLVLALSVHAQEMAVNFDPAATKIEFTLAATMHTVRGTFRLKSGHILFDPKTGNASGTVIIDARSANTDNTSRDQKMHAEILESAKFPEIAFTPTGEQGSIAQLGTSRVAISGVIRLHGQDHPVTMTITIQTGAGGQYQASTKFAVPYAQWGLQNPSTFILRVSDTVNLDVQTAGQISLASSSH